MRHTRKSRFFCGETDGVRSCVEKGWMRYAGRKSFVPDPYFELTSEGESVLTEAPPN